MYRKVRIILASAFFIGITLLLCGIATDSLGWMAKLQFLPSCLALNLCVTVLITLVTFVFGRIYCSVICPLGVFQDLVILLRRKLAPRRKFKFHPEIKWLRYLFLAVFVLCLVFGVQVVVALIAPYSAYGRMVSSIVNPSRTWAIAVPAITFVIISLTAWFCGREWCSSICPVGTVLSLFSRIALLRPVIDEDKCVHCHACGKKCKASCIDTDRRAIDYSRCVDCFDCLDSCKTGAIRYKFAYGKKPKGGEEPAPDSSRRSFIASAAVLAGAAVAGVASADDMLAAEAGSLVLPEKKNPCRDGNLVPFGAGSVENFYDHCTACGLCISACPNEVLRPSVDLAHLMQPQMQYDKGYCRPECTKCSELCPSGAILKIDKEQKLLISIGYARVNLDTCVVRTDKVDCGNCARHCPVGAIRMVEDSGRRIPVVNEAQCIGCGACEHLCPARPVSAITVSGHQVHQSR